MSESRFDFIIVGGGTAGCVLASRLSSDPSLRVLLLEAGANRNDDPKVKTPLTSRRMFRDPNYDWDFETEPQVGLDNRVIQHTRGRMIGGSSAINSHSLVFPNRDMHDTWAKMASDDRWSWEQIVDYYGRFYGVEPASSESNGAVDANASEGTGPVRASYPQEMNQLQRVWEEVFESLDMKSKSSGPGGQCFGGFTTTNAIDCRPGKGERSHAGVAYLQTVIGRRNLIVGTEAVVERVILQETSSPASESHTAVGVSYTKDGRKMFAKADKEVILCAGAFGSPQLLELSGIGSRKILENADIECILDLPGVGENLQDHLNFGPSIEVGSNIETQDAAIGDPAIMATLQEQYSKTRTGPLAEGAAYSFAFWPLQLFNSASEEAELQHLLNTETYQKMNDSQRQHKDFIKRMILAPNEASAAVFMTRMQRYTTAESRADGNYMSVIAMLSHPFSRGSSHIISADPNEHPKIDCAYLTHPWDGEILARHCVQIERLLEQPSYSDIVKKGGNRLPRGYGVPSESSDEVKTAISKYAATNYHPCGTCAMISRGDGGVVDGSLKVYGTINLRVCDASIFPIIPRGNILTTVYAVAEKAADIILGDHCQYSK